MPSLANQQPQTRVSTCAPPCEDSARGLSGRRAAAPAPADASPTPFDAVVVRRLGEGRGGFDTVTPIPLDVGDRGAAVVIQISSPRT